MIMAPCLYRLIIIFVNSAFKAMDMPFHLTHVIRGSHSHPCPCLHGRIQTPKSHAASQDPAFRKEVYPLRALLPTDVISTRRNHVFGILNPDAARCTGDCGEILFAPRREFLRVQDDKHARHKNASTHFTPR
jgi:hypothetical protein